MARVELDIETSAVRQMAQAVGADFEDTDFRFALAVFCMDNHSGQWSVEYEALCEVDARLRDNHIEAIRSGGSDEWDSAHQWYEALTDNWKLA